MKEKIKRIKKILLNNKLEVLMFSAIFILLMMRAYASTNFSEDLILTYKFTNNDSYDWWVSGLEFLSGNPYLSYRNPGLPGIIWILDQFNLTILYSFVSNFNYFIFILISFLITKAISKSNLASYLIIVFMFWNFAFLNLAHYILADLYAINFIAISLYLIIKNHWKWGFFTLGISGLFQSFAFFLLIFLLIAYFRNEIKELGYNPKNYLDFLKENFTRGTLLVLIFLNFNLLWFIYRAFLFENPLYSRIVQFDLLNFRPDYFDIFLLMSLDDFGILLIFVIFYSIYKFKEFLKTRVNLYVLLSFIFTVIFWGMIYQWTDPRFTYYTIPFVIYYFANFYNLYITSFGRKVILSIIFLTFVVYPGSVDTGKYNIINDISITNIHYLEFDIKTNKGEGKHVRVITEKPLNINLETGREIHPLKVIHPEIWKYQSGKYRAYLDEYSSEYEYVTSINECAQQDNLSLECMQGLDDYRAYSTLLRLYGLDYRELQKNPDKERLPIP